MSNERQIDPMVPPKIIEEKLISQTRNVLESQLQGKLEISLDYFRNGYELLGPLSQVPENWSVIASAIIRIVPRKGCDQIKVTKVEEIVAALRLYWLSHFVVFVKIKYSASINFLTITNLSAIISVINSTICKKCLKHEQLCKCPKIDKPDLMSLTLKEEPNLSDYNGQIFAKEDNDLRSESQDLSYKEQPRPKMDFGKFEGLITGLAKTMKLKSVVKIRERAHNIIAQNPSISEEDLAKELLRNGS